MSRARSHLSTDSPPAKPTNRPADPERLYGQIRIGERTVLSVRPFAQLTPGCGVAVVQNGRARYGRWWPAKEARRPYRSYVGFPQGEFAEFVDYLATNDTMKRPVDVPPDASVVLAEGILIVEPYAMDPDTPKWKGPGIGPSDRNSAAAKAAG